MRATAVLTYLVVQQAKEFDGVAQFLLESARLDLVLQQVDGAFGGGSSDGWGGSEGGSSPEQKVQRVHGGRRCSCLLVVVDSKAQL